MGKGESLIEDTPSPCQDRWGRHGPREGAQRPYEMLSNGPARGASCGAKKKAKQEAKLKENEQNTIAAV